MSASIDSLSIKVDTSARGANQQLDKLVQKMMQLRSTVNGINAGNLNNLSFSIQNFSRAAMGLGQVKAADFTRMAKGIEKLSNIRKGELNRAATAITNISKAFSNIGNVSEGAEKIGQLASGIAKLGYKSSTQAIENIPKLTVALRDMMAELSRAPSVSNNLVSMTHALANLAANAGGLKNFSNGMFGAAGNMSKCHGVLSRFTGGMSRFGSSAKNAVIGLKNFALHSRGASNSTATFISKLGMLYAKIWSIKRIFDMFGKSVGSAMDYIEEYNYFSTTMDKIAGEWSRDYKKYGYDNADAYGKSFKDRLTGTLSKMTGFQMEDDGTLTDTGTKNLGLDVTEMTNYAASVAQVTNSVGLVGEASTVTSQALSMLAGDMSSFRNQDMSTVMNNFSSGLIGQSRALYQYGIDITNATLAAYAHDLGIKKNISDMAQSEKMQLRMIAILDQSKVAWGDLAKTINSPSNQLRLLQNNFKTLSRTIGNIFLPVVAKVLPYINGLVIAIRRLFEWSASLLGIDLSKIIKDSGAGGSGAFDGLEEDANDASDAVDDTTDSVKKLAKQLMGFDELNVITTNKSKDKDKDEDSAPIDLTNQLSAALADYEAVWNKAYKDMTSDAEKFANKLTKLFKDAWTSGDGSDIGSAIAEWLNKGISWVNKNVDTFAAGLKKIANMLATGVNGFVEKLDWAGLGTAIGKSLKAFFDAETHFFDTVNWVNLGKALSTSLNSAVDSGVLQSYFTSIASKLKAGIETAFGAVTTFKFGNLGTALGQGINDFFEKMGEKNKQTGLNGWQELGVTLSTGIAGIAQTIATAVDEVDFDVVGEAIVDLINSLDTSDMGWNLGKMASSLANAFYTLVSNKETWTSLGTKIGDGINGFFKGMNEVNSKTGLTGWEALGKDISKTISGIAETISTALETVDWDSVGQSIGDFLGSIDFKGVAWSLGDMAAKFLAALAEAIKGAFDKSPIATSIVVGLGALKLASLTTKTFEKISATILGLLGKSIGENETAITKLAETVKGGITKAVGKIKDFATEKFKPIAEKIIDKLGTAMSTVSGKLQILADKIKGAINLAFGKIKDFSMTYIKPIAEKIMTKIAAAVGAETATVSGIASAIGTGIGTAFSQVPALMTGPLSGVLSAGAAATAATIFTAVVAAIGAAFAGFQIGKAIGNAIVSSENKEYQYNWKFKDLFTYDASEWKQGIADWWKDIKKWWGNKYLKVKNKLSTVKKDVTDWWSNVKGWWGDRYASVKSKLTTVKNDVKGWWGNVKDWWGDKAVKLGIAFTFVKDELKSAVNVVISWINKYIIDALNKISIKVPKIKVAGKEIFGGKTFGFNVKHISTFASGGFPEQGQYFLARESGPELVGTIGGKSAVVNNPQIVQSVSDGVFNALAPVLTQVVNSINSLNGKIDSMSGNGVDVEKYTEGDLLKVVRKEDSNYRKRTGRSAFTY